jgi:selenocysteine lyase/cysteine desulfurase
MIDPLVPPERYILPPGTESNLVGSFGGLAWKSSTQVLEKYAEGLATGQAYNKTLKAARLEVLRRLASQVQAYPPQVATSFHTNATEALIRVVECVEPRIEDQHTIIVPDGAYSSLTLVAMSLRERSGAQLLNPAGTTEDIVSAISPQCRLIIIEHFDTSRCEMLDIAQIAAAAHSVGARILVDVSQTVGLFPVNYQNFDAAFATVYKGLGGLSNGSSPLWLNTSRWRPDEVQPIYMGRNSAQPKVGQGIQLKPDIGDRLQPGGLPWLNILLLLDALRNMQDLGLEPQNIAEHILALEDVMLSELKALSTQSPQLDLKIAPPENSQGKGPHITVRMARDRAEEVYEQLVEKGIFTSFDEWGLRLSPRPHNGEEDVRRAVEALGEALIELEYSRLDPSWYPVR